MRFVIMFMAMLGTMLAMMQGAEARVRIRVDLASQTMQVSSASGAYVWPISSARSGFRTPHGTFGVKWMEAMHRSHKYHNSPMPHSIFFSGGYAIHGTYATGSLGRPASHGCIRLAPQNAALLYGLVKREGAQIAINGAVPAGGRVYAKRNVHPTVVYASSRSRNSIPRAATYAYDGGQTYDYGRRLHGRALGYAPAAPGMGEWLLDPGGW
ncbi:L,D-transpeptidase [Lichenifustis flavocetrariae]|uniref:L,D-transpeptidase n=1 Tax=Lichenifustis flavocetrariae TaxID=2949735 RepID=A0AA41YZ11_9HYPH|nr:L,D-transpeptidase [Lichenifustis flavocetrariae]MCW6509900.1 L,D-transpeptidase [Lichenifustis flavocetrariae]